jgi:hypothetical protein
MLTSVVVQKPSLSIGALPLLVALLAVFFLGGAGGYLVRGLGTPPAAFAQPAADSRPAAICPAGTHVVVWYTARTWACVSDAAG